MHDVIICDNLLTRGYIDAIEADLTRTGFPWLYVRDVTSRHYGSNSGFVHPAFDYGKEPSEWFSFIKPLVYSIEEAHSQKIEELFRIRVGFLLPTNEPEYKYNTPHVDFLWDHYTACFYVNETDGDTVVFDQNIEELSGEISEMTLNEYANNAKFTILKSIEPKRNRVCIFNGKNFHSSTKPKHYERRIVITVNYR
jgi:hypothetical protein